jgi:hypothetical protein
MSGLFARPDMAAGQDGFRDTSSKQSIGLRVAGFVGGVSRVEDRSIAPSAQSLASSGLGRRT